ncbi:MAG: class I SAM-dependent methyltransferase [Euryarchaeota archaeon]|nr:class I SAM-dependent methyltransferase [Euryarchaeota archaeon]
MADDEGPADKGVAVMVVSSADKLMTGRASSAGMKTGSDAPRPIPAGDPMANRVMMDRIAALFDASRSRPWPQVASFLEASPPGSVLLDLASGNGRHSLVAAEKGHLPVAVDVSRELPRLLSERASVEGLAVEPVEGDALRLPFLDGVFDAAVFIAGVHCIRGRANRLQALGELRRVMKPQGSALVSVWSREQDRFRSFFKTEKERHPLRVDAHHEAGLPGPPPEFGDIDIPWRHGMPEEVPRFFHLYDMVELVSDLESAGFVVVSHEAATLGRSETPDNLFATVRPT